MQDFVMMSSARLSWKFSDFNVRDSSPSFYNFILSLILENWDAFMDNISDFVDEGFKLSKNWLFFLLSSKDLFI